MNIEENELIMKKGTLVISYMPYSEAYNIYCGICDKPLSAVTFGRKINDVEKINHFFLDVKNTDFSYLGEVNDHECP